jgi:hypothetical protein
MLIFQLSTLVASAAAALAFPGMHGSQPMPANACFTLAFGLALMGVMLVLYLTLSIRMASLEYLRLKPCSSFPLATPGFIGMSSAFNLLIGIIVMAHDTWRSGLGDPEPTDWHCLLVLVPLGGIFLLCVGVVVSSEIVARRNMSIYGAAIDITAP